MGVRPAVGVLVVLLAAGCDRASTQPADPPLPAAASASPLEAAAPDAADADAGLSPPLSPEQAKKLARSVHTSFDYSERYVFQYGGGRMEVVDDTFVLVAVEKTAPLDDAMKRVHDTVESLWHDPGWHGPTQAATVWVCDSHADYLDFASWHTRKLAHPTESSVYMPEDPVIHGTSEIFFSTDGHDPQAIGRGIARHLIQYDFPRAPAWLAEGVSALFELASPTPDGETHPHANSRLQVVRATLSKPSQAPLVTLDALFSLGDDASFRKQGALSVALAREAARWMDSQGRLWNFYRLFRQTFLDDETGEKSFAATFDGKTPAEATSDFLAWIQSSASE